MAVAGTLISLAGWSYIPNLVTEGIIRFIRPYVRSPITDWHRRLTFSLVILSYLVYNFVSASLAMPPNYYQLLKVSPEVDDNGLKMAFRAFARKNHPDRVGPDGAALFMHVRAGYEALLDPTKRWAYDRFGPEALKCTECITHHDYLHWGLLQSLGFHIVSFLTLLFFTAIGFANSVSFWRFLLFFALGLSELSLIFSPPLSSKESFSENSHLLSFIFPTRVPYQHILFLHQAFFFLGMALSRVAPALFPDASRHSHDSSVKLAQAVAERVNAIDQELYGQLQSELHTVQPSHSTDEPTESNKVADAPTMDLLTREMENMIIEGQLAQEGGEVAQERTDALRRHRTFSLPSQPQPNEATLSALVSSGMPLHLRWPSPSPSGREKSPLSPLNMGSSLLRGVSVWRDRVNEMSMPGTYQSFDEGKSSGPGFVRARSKSC